MRKKILMTAAIFGALAVVAGAFGAHWLEGNLSIKRLEVWNTAVQYQFYHSIALLFTTSLTRYKTRLVGHIYNLFTYGMILFCGTLYLLACSDLLGWSWIHLIGVITPIGGLMFIAGWVVIGCVGLRNKFV
jgi:uncharacterized membrane protein YgdD (TMEM256/DUF423 family)